MPQHYGRPVAESRALASLLGEAGRLRAFVPPFRFGSFFSPEDTLLCACAAEGALSHARSPRRRNGRSPDPLRIAELTTGSGLVGLHLLRLEGGSTLTGLDVDPAAIDTARRNARMLGLADRAKFDCADLWSDSTPVLLGEYGAHLIICNPPYVPEPPGGKLELEAGAGPEGTAHLLRTLELVEKTQPRSLALSWCSLSDPARIVREAESIGYGLNSLFLVVLADGEYSGSVHEYLRSLAHAYINEDAETTAAVAPDGSGRFAYLLMAGDFSRTDAKGKGISESIGRLCEEFAARGLDALEDPVVAVPVRTWLLDRWDELGLRVLLHGQTKLSVT